MPASGDQHTPCENPFMEAKPRVSEWTAREIATIASKLDKQLGPEYISSRSGPGGSLVHYLTAEKCIGLANEVFGFNGWSSSIQNIQVDFADENAQTQRVSIGLSVIVRVTLRDGTYHEDIGYGSIENARGKAMAFEKAKKEGTTDGLKRALRSFGNVLGNCIYDKDYVKQITKVKAQPVKRFDQDSLHRHADFVRRDAVKPEAAAAAATTTTTTTTTMAVAATVPPLKPEPAESFEDFLGELDEADFCVAGEGHPDEVVLHSLPAQGPADRSSAANPRPPRPPNQTAAGGGNSRGPQTPGPARPGVAAHQEAPQKHAAPAGRGQAGAQRLQQPPPRPAEEPVAFFSARSVSANAEAGQNGGGGGGGGGAKQLFNPKAESPSIRKTAGIDHSSSRPVARNGQHVEPVASQAAGGAGAGAGSGSGAGAGAGAGSLTPGRQWAAGARGNVVNPSLDQARRIGAPGGPGSPLANRGQYKPPSMKRPLAAGDGGGAGAARSPLVDVAANVAAAEAVDAKRAKTAA